ncbi:MAG: hypothetical protein JNK45_34160 [Myxococcales bacterium]|nr:hypothetical protein [Myxococcales bacterium]
MSEPRKPTPTAAAKPAAAKPAAAASAGAAIATTAEPSTSRLSWILGWIVAPASVVAAIFGGGVILGAHNPDGWFARSVMWVVGIF